MAIILNQKQVQSLLPMDACMGLMETALSALARGEASNPLRSMLWLPDRSGLLGVMPGYLPPAAIGLKVVGVFPGNHGGDLDSHQGVVMLFDETTGVPLVILEASTVTAVRTAAVSGVATRLLARREAGDLAILGSGVQARTHLAAMAVARTLRRVRVYSPDTENLRSFCTRQSRRHGLAVEAAASAEDAVAGADIVCTTTSSRTPVLEGAWLAAGAHINAVGSSIAAARELDTAAVVRSRLFVDRRESTLNESGDFLIPRGEGAIGDDHILGEIGDLLLGRIPGRGSDDEITLFKSLGLAVEDLATARYVYERALATGVGTTVDLSGQRHVDAD